MQAGADAFRINMSHGRPGRKAKLVEAIRALEKELRPADDDPVRPAGAEAAGRQVRGRLGRCSKTGQTFVLDRDKKPGDADRVELPHPELFEAVRTGDRLLIDDGKVG